MMGIHCIILNRTCGNVSLGVVGSEAGRQPAKKGVAGRIVSSFSLASRHSQSVTEG